MGVGLIPYRNVAFNGHNIKKKVPYRYKAMKAQIKSGGKALLFL